MAEQAIEQRQQLVREISRLEARMEAALGDPRNAERSRRINYLKGKLNENKNRD